MGVGALITRRSQVQILPPPPRNTRSEALFDGHVGEGLSPFRPAVQHELLYGLAAVARGESASSSVHGADQAFRGGPRRQVPARR
jgi:hypothetical protein